MATATDTTKAPRFAADQSGACRFCDQTQGRGRFGSDTMTAKQLGVRLDYVVCPHCGCRACADCAHERDCCTQVIEDFEDGWRERLPAGCRDLLAS